MGRRESVVETYLMMQAAKRGAFVRKVVYQGRKSSPDRWCFFPNGELLIVECKALMEKPTLLQVHEMRLLREHGFKVCWVDSIERVEEALDTFKSPDFDKAFPL